MDILASIFAYLFCVAGILGAMALSLSLVLSSPTRSVAPAGAAAAQAAAQTAAVAVKPNTADPAVTKTIASAVVVSQPNAAPAPHSAASRLAKKDTRRKPALAQARRLLQEDKARRWAYQQDADFDTRFLGYAD
jgi:hypothetical protein